MPAKKERHVSLTWKQQDRLRRKWHIENCGYDPGPHTERQDRERRKLNMAIFGYDPGPCYPEQADFSPTLRLDSNKPSGSLARYFKNCEELHKELEQRYGKWKPLTWKEVERRPYTPTPEEVEAVADLQKALKTTTRCNSRRLHQPSPGTRGFRASSFARLRRMGRMAGHPFSILCFTRACLACIGLWGQFGDRAG